MNKETAVKTAAKWWADKMTEHASEEQLTVFQKALREGIAARLERDGFAFIGCDYDPNEELWAAAEKAGFSVQDFPSGTDVSVATCDGEHYFVVAYTGWGHCRKLLEPCDDLCSNGERREDAENE